MSLGKLDHRKRTAIALLAVTSLALAACGRSEESGTPEEQSEEISSGEATGEIDVWAMGTEGEALKAFSKEFEEANPDATLNVTAVPWESAYDKLSGAIASGETPDVSLVGTTWMGEFAEA
ncbi:MAG: ABC transporter substrate-binding protein, partial [Nocardioides sp.]